MNGDYASPAATVKPALFRHPREYPATTTLKAIIGEKDFSPSLPMGQRAGLRSTHAGEGEKCRCCSWKEARNSVLAASPADISPRKGGTGSHQHQQNSTAASQGSVCPGRSLPSHPRCLWLPLTCSSPPDSNPHPPGQEEKHLLKT